LPEVVIDPLTRIEGHLAIRIELNESKTKITNAWCHATMFRGFEAILCGRDPIDAQFLSTRICGVCSIDHGIAASRCLEDAFGINPTPLGIILRNLLQYSNWLYDHILHCFILAGPDYGPPFGKMEEFVPFSGEGYLQALKMLKIAAEASALFAGKLPHGAAIIPTGVTVSLNTKSIAEYIYRIKKLKSWIDEYMIPLFDKFYEMYKGELEEVGKREANLIAYGTFEDLSLDPKKRAFKPGVIVDGKLVTNDLYGEIEPHIVEHVSHSWYTDDSGGKPSEEKPPTPMFTGFEKNKKYSYSKAPRWKNYVMETGPLARMWSTALQSGGRVVTDAGEWKPPENPDTVERIYARAYETAYVATKIMEEANKLLELINKGEENVCGTWKTPSESQGKGLVEAARGALGHWITIKDGRIERYQVITPTTWNASPRDSNGRRGAIEEALTESLCEENPELTVVRIVRAFDPCLACTVHAYRADGKKKLFDVRVY